MKVRPVKRCEHCGADYPAQFATHCMANFREGAARTELLGRWVERAEKAEAKVRELTAWIEGYPCACPRPETTSARKDPP